MAGENGSQQPPEATLEDRLALMLAEVVDATLLTVRDVGGPGNVELRVGSFLPELSERACALLEEAGR